MSKKNEPWYLTKPESIAHRKLVAKIIGKEPDEIDCIGGAEWKIETKFGQARVSTHLNDASIYFRFEKGEKWKELISENNRGELNPYSGKWNLHATGGDGLAISQFNAARLQNRLRKIIDKTAAL